jgi:pimeloyl-ACP methyl ester carboxylesterase
MSLAIALPSISDAPAANVRFRQANKTDDGLSCWLAMPERMVADEPPLVAVHGIRRNARQQAELFAQRANALGRPVIAPLFDSQTWPRYQQAIRRGRADLALIALIESLKTEGVCQTDRFELFGFSGGAQFAHRFAMMHPHLITRLTVASAGWYTFPDQQRFPYGLSARPEPADPWSSVTEDQFQRFLAIPTQVCVGADDTWRDSNLRSGEQIDAQQGENRLVRGIRWTRALQEAAKSCGLAARASFIALSASGHDFRQCVISGGLDRIVIPQTTSMQQPSSPCGKDCRACPRPCGATLRLLRPDQ